MSSNVRHPCILNRRESKQAGESALYIDHACAAAKQNKSSASVSLSVFVSSPLIMPPNTKKRHPKRPSHCPSASASFPNSHKIFPMLSRQDAVNHLREIASDGEPSANLNLRFPSQQDLCSLEPVIPFEEDAEEEEAGDFIGSEKLTSANDTQPPSPNDGFCLDADGGFRLGFDGLYSLCNDRGFPKTVMVVVDASQEAKTALLWALSHLVTEKDTLVLLHVTEPLKFKSISPKCNLADDSVKLLASYLKSLCKTHNPEVNVKILITRGDNKAATIVKEANSWPASVLVLGQKKPSLLNRFLTSKKEQEVVNHCIHNAQCVTLAVSKQKSSMGGFLISSKWHRNFWLLA